MRGGSKCYNFIQISLHTICNILLLSLQQHIHTNSQTLLTVFKANAWPPSFFTLNMDTCASTSLPAAEFWFASKRFRTALFFGSVMNVRASLPLSFGKVV